MDMMWGMSGMMGFMFLAWLVVIAALVAGVWWIVTHVRPSRRNDALEILRERYARGEISKEEYESRRRDLAGAQQAEAGVQTAERQVEGARSRFEQARARWWRRRRRPCAPRRTSSGTSTCCDFLVLGHHSRCGRHSPVTRRTLEPVFQP